MKGKIEEEMSQIKVAFKGKITYAKSVIEKLRNCWVKFRKHI